MKQIKYWIMASRPKTLIISISAIILAVTLAYPKFDFLSFIVCLLTAISLQIAVNLANDYSDGVSGVDTDQRLGPTRVVQAKLIPAIVVKRAYISLLVFTIFLAIVLSIHVSYIYFIILLFSIVATITYSAGPFSIAGNALGEVFAFLFFGTIAITATYYAQTQKINSLVLLSSCVIGCYSSATMLINNIRDIKSDKAANKNTLAVKIGLKSSKILYVALLFCSLGFHLLAYKKIYIPTLIPVFVCLPVIFILIKEVFSFTGKHLNKTLAKTAALSLLYTISILCLQIYQEVVYG